MMIKKKKLIRKMVTKVMIIKETEKNINLRKQINIKHCKRLRPNIYKIRSPSHIKKTLFVVFLDFEF